MDMLSFESLHASIVRVRAQESQEEMTHDRLAAHGDQKAMKQWEKLTKKRAELDLKPDGATDKDAFVARLGKGS